MPLTLTALTADRFDEWRTDAVARVARHADASRLQVGRDAIAHAEELVSRFLPDGHSTRSARILTISDGERERGSLWLRIDERHLLVVDLAFDATTSAENDELFALVREIAESAGLARLVVGVHASDAAARSLVDGRGFTRASIQMLLEPIPEREVPAGIEVAPMTAERFPSFAAASEEAFAEDLVASGRYTRTEAAAESRRQMVLELPEGLASEGQLLFTASVGGTEVGILWLGIRTRDGSPHVFVLDIEVAAGQQRRGFGRALMIAAEREARRAGAASVGLHVFGFNQGAIALYEQLGYRSVEERHVLDL